MYEKKNEAQKNTNPGQLFPVGKNLKNLGGKNPSPGDFLYKFGSKKENNR